MNSLDETAAAIVGAVAKLDETTPAFSKAKQDSEHAAAVFARVGTATPSSHMKAAVAKLGEVEKLLADAVKAASDAADQVRAAKGEGGGLARGDSRSASAGTPTGGAHGVQQRRAGVMQGPVVFSAPAGATSTEVGQAKEYVDAANQANREGRLSPAGRVSLDRKAARAKERAAARERQRAATAGQPYGDDVAAHLPDTTWVGQPDPPGGWGRHTKKVNSSLGAQSAKYPVGYRPTEFHLDDSWSNADSR